MKPVVFAFILFFSMSSGAAGKAKQPQLKGFNDKGAFASCEPPPPEQMCAAIAAPLHVACADGGGKIIQCKGCKILCSKNVPMKSTKPTM